MHHEKQIQIPESLFALMASYCLIPEQCTNENLQAIKKGITEKLNRMIEHDLYTKYKTAPTDAQKEQARQNYLEKKGINSNFRW